MQGDYWSFNLAGAYLPIILLRNNVSAGQDTVTDTYRQYIYIYLPGILGAILALISVQLPLVGRKWSLVFSAVCQGLAMAMYTQVKTTAGYVGLNAFEYVMQTVSLTIPCPANTDGGTSTSTRSSTLLLPNCLTQPIVEAPLACCRVWEDWLASLHPSLENNTLGRRVREYCGLVLVGYGSRLSPWSFCLLR